MDIIFNILIFVLLLLATIFGLVLLILIVAIFSPIRYNINVEKNEDTIIASGKVSWFLRILSASFTYNEIFDQKIKIFGISLETFTKIKKQKKPKLTKEISREETNKKDTININEETENKEQNSEELNTKNTEYKSTKNTESKQKSKKSKEKNKKENTLKIIKRNILYVYNYPNKKQILNLFFKYLKSLFKVINPKKIKIAGEIGASDPYQTGILLAVLSTFLPRLSHNIQGNFTETTINGSLYIQGKVSIANLMLPTLAFLIKKPIRKLIRDIIKRI